MTLQIDIKPENVNILDGMADDLQAECDRYEAKIASMGGIELFLGGIGPDGHIAFSELLHWWSNSCNRRLASYLL